MMLTVTGICIYTALAPERGRLVLNMKRSGILTLLTVICIISTILAGCAPNSPSVAFFI